MSLINFLKSKNYNSNLKEILLSIAKGSIEVYTKLNEDEENINRSLCNT